jgi:hypothetical protein
MKDGSIFSLAFEVVNLNISSLLLTFLQRTNTLRCLSFHGNFRQLAKLVVYHFLSVFHSIYYLEHTQAIAKVSSFLALEKPINPHLISCARKANFLWILLSVLLLGPNGW